MIVNYTTHDKVFDVKYDEHFKIIGYDKIVSIENVYKLFVSEVEYFKWLVDELESNRTEEEMELFGNDFSDFLVKEINKNIK